MPIACLHPACDVFHSYRQPAPLHNYEKVNIGDVGYIRGGRFHLLFSAGLPLGNRVLGRDVPANFVPLDVEPIFQDEPRKPGPLKTRFVKSSGVDAGASLDT